MADKPPLKKLDALVLLAKSDLGSRRKSPWRWFVLLAVICLVIALFGWMVSAPPPVPALLLAAADGIALPDEKIMLIARVEAKTPVPEPKLEKTPLYFQESVSNRVQEVLTDAAGVVRQEATFPGSILPATLFVRYPGDALRRSACQAASSIYVRPKDTAWLIVDADHALPAGTEDDLWGSNNLRIGLEPGAVAALRGLRGRREIVYVASSAEHVLQYLNLKAWLEGGWKPTAEQLPPGPLLARATAGKECTAQEFLGAVAADLQKRYAPPVVALAARPEEAHAFLDAGVRTIMLGAGDVPKGAIPLKSWSDGLMEKIEGK
jgi:hypothetical protein